MPSITLGELAGTLGLSFNGDPALRLEGINSLDAAGAGELSFIVSAKYADTLTSTGAAAVIVPAALAEQAPCATLISDNPYLTYARVSHLFREPVREAPGVASGAVIEEGAVVADSARIGHGAVISAGASIGADCSIGANCYIGPGTVIGAGTHLFANVTIYHDCVLGENCRLQSGVVIGGEGFGYARDGAAGWQRINQVGRVVIGDRVEIGAGTTVDRGAIADTVIEDGVILDNLIMIAHNVHIGRNTAIAACTGIAGSAVIGADCTIGGSVNINGHISICDKAHVTAVSFVMRSITEPGAYSSGIPAESNRKWNRTLARLRRLDQSRSR
ncbi:UDP-3-O-(3-hydroxymyristoyl)glucosamine N-acyltransferase [Granulosicoccaceae sp. 1_MG-2023]|nr:UDP-3-O-(3-hydroxymyristoyl)glucosamine N-acyltransferase [Granulosicoccaceae sp. 1_MG-2023]